MTLLFCSLHWSDLHGMLCEQLPAGTVSFSHSVVGFQQHGDQVKIIVEQHAGTQQDRQFEVTADLLVAADGSNSSVRQLLYPEDVRR